MHSPNAGRKGPGSRPIGPYHSRINLRHRYRHDRLAHARGDSLPAGGLVTAPCKGAGRLDLAALDRCRRCRWASSPWTAAVRAPSSETTEASGLDDLRRRLRREDALRGWPGAPTVVDAARVDETLQLGDLSRADPGLVRETLAFLGATKISPIHHLRAEAGSQYGIVASIGSGAGVDDVAHLHVRAPFRSAGGGAGDGQLRAAGAPAPPPAIRADRDQVGLGK